jgi:two-component sensor histidine kinase
MDSQDDALRAFRSFFAPMPEAFLLLDPESLVVLACNAAAAGILDTPRKALMGRSLSEMAANRPDWEEFARTARISRNSLPGAFRYMSGTGEQISLRADAFTLPAGGSGLLVLRLRQALAAHRDFGVLNEQIERLTREVGRRRQAEQHQRTLVEELNHRVMNMLTTVQGIVRQTLRNASVASETQRMTDARIAALAAGHRLIARASWNAVELSQMASAILLPLDVGSGRIRVHGQDVLLRPNQAMALAMAFHELATNAVKYGALSNNVGHVRISWEVRPTGDIHLSWVEEGGPPVKEPHRHGFGSRLIDRNLPAELGGSVRREFLPQGLRCAIDFPLKR